MRTLPSFAAGATAFAALTIVALAGCGGGTRPATLDGTAVGNASPGDAPATDRLPWEDTLTVGARFTLVGDDDGSGTAPRIEVAVSAIEQDGATRIYRLSWGDDDGGPPEIRVSAGTVTIGDATAADMKPPLVTDTGAICHGADFSNPDGCDDICDADLCLSATAGITEISGLYAPGQGSYRQP